MSHHKRFFWQVLAAMALSLWGAASAAVAQSESVTLEVVEPVGLAGKARAGCWVPVLVKITNPLEKVRHVICELAYPDADGDVVQQRVAAVLSPKAALGPKRTDDVWLYGLPALNSGSSVEWWVRVIEVGADTNGVFGESGQVIASQKIVSLSLIDDKFGRVKPKLIGVLGLSVTGLADFEDQYLQHEPCVTIKDLTAESMPDRWYGLSMLQALVWAPGSVGPTPADLPPESLGAVREWVRRGGHLVVVLPKQESHVKAWFKTENFTPPLSDMMPNVRVTPKDNAPVPSWLGSPTKRLEPIKVNVLEVAPGDGGVSVLLRGQGEVPLVVASAYGFGRVTVIGVDLTDPNLSKAGLPDSLFPAYPGADSYPNAMGERLWATVFGWRTGLNTREMNDRIIQDEKMSRPEARAVVSVDRFIPESVAMRETATTAVLGAIFIFAIYWIAAGPFSFAVLKKRGRVRHSWAVFTVIVCLFTAVTWGWAMVVRPTQERVAHFTALDIDAASGRVHAHGWVSLFTPTHGRVDVRLAGEQSRGGFNTLASPGVSAAAEAASSFIDTQRYVVDKADASYAQVPMRATAKQFEVDYLSDAQSGIEGLDTALTWDRYPVPEGAAGLPYTVKHNLKGTLSNVVVLYCPGDGGKIYAARFGDWAQGHSLSLVRLMSREDDLFFSYERDPNFRDLDHSGWVWRGYVKYLMDNISKQEEDPAHPIIDRDEATTAASAQMLSFFGALPSPRYWDVSNFYSATNPTYTRGIGRALDMSAQLALKRLIIVGQWTGSETPLPLTINGSKVTSKGWTMVRWVCPIPATTPAPAADK